MTYIIAEISGNHGGNLDRALDLIGAAADAGAHYAKFQLYKPEDLPDFDAKLNFPVPVAWLRPMFGWAKHCRIDLFASVFAPWAVEALAPFKPKYFKIASPESTKLHDYATVVDAIRRVNGTVMWSHGKDWSLVEKYKNDWDDVFMYCKQGYPATLELDDFYRIDESGGFSDHTVGITAALAAIAVMDNGGFIEKHFKLNNDCVDAAFSIDPVEMRALCDLCL